MIDLSTHTFYKPIKCIKSPQVIGAWLRGTTYKEYKAFIEKLADSIKSRPNDCRNQFEKSAAINSISDLLKQLNDWVDATENEPQEAGNARFGNPAFRTWHKLLEDNAVDLCKNILTGNDKIKGDEELLKNAAEEISVYLLDSFGNSIRIDYGSGHEMAFIIFLYCLFKLGVLEVGSDADLVHTTLTIFREYLTLCRKFQRKYRLEPAGSHGVYGLDDYQFTCYIFGAAQMLNNSEDLRPSDFPRVECVAKHKDKYMFFEAIHFINESKTGPFGEHSNQLWNISGVERWEKVHTGMIKMYEGEVLKKYPIVQHCYFGSLFPWNGPKPKN